MQIVGLYIEGNNIEFFQDENVTINSSVQNINDVSKVFTDFSQSFTVPASKENNRIFKHYYKADITGGFDARTKKSAVITINNLTFKKGKIRLEAINMSNQIAKSYKVTFFGEIVKLKDLIGDDKLNELDYLDNLSHDYDGATVLQGLTDGLDLLPSYDKGVIYPLISPKRRFLYDSTVNTPDDDSSINIADVGSTNGLLWRDLKPAIRLIHIFEAIEDKYNLTFTRDFLGRSEFTQLYMWLNRDDGYLNTRSQSVNNLIDWSNGDSGFIDFATDTLTLALNNPTGQPSDNLQFSIFITPDAGFLSVPYSVVIVDDNDGIVYEQNNLTGVQQLDGGFWNPAEGTVKNLSLKYYINPESAFQYTAIIKNRYNILSVFPTASILEETGTALLSYDADLVITKQMPDLKVYDFISGVIKMFNLVAIGQENGNIYINTLNDWYAAGKIFNITKYVDTKKIDVKRGNLLNRILFNYEKPETFLASQFFDNTGTAYGDLEATLFDSSGEILDGKELKIKIPFDTMVYERISNTGTSNLTNIQYGFYVNKEQTPSVFKPLIFYRNQNNVILNPISFIDENNVSTAINSNVFIPNTAYDLLNVPNFTINFNAELSTYNYNLMENSLYKNYWEDYITDIFSEKRRVYNLEAVLPLSIQRQLELNDRLIINDRRYLINNIKSNLLNNKVTLELVNDIYRGVSSADVVDNLQLNIYNALIPFEGDVFTITIQASGTTTVSVVDNGYGVFSTVTPLIVKDNGFVTVTVNQNNGAIRTQNIRFTNNGIDTDFTLTQESKFTSIRFDSGIITFDNGFLTFDNN